MLEKAEWANRPRPFLCPHSPPRISLALRPPFAPRSSLAPLRTFSHLPSLAPRLSPALLHSLASRPSPVPLPSISPWHLYLRPHSPLDPRPSVPAPPRSSLVPRPMSSPRPSLAPRRTDARWYRRESGRRRFTCYLPHYRFRDDRNVRGQYDAWQGLPSCIFLRRSHFYL